MYPEDFDKNEREQRSPEYSWNRGDRGNMAFAASHPKKRSKGKTFAFAAGVIALLAVCIVVSMSVYNAIDGMLSEPPYEEPVVTDPSLDSEIEIPSIGIVKLEEYYIDEEPVSGEPMTTVQIVRTVKPAIVGIVSNINQGRYFGQSSGSGVIMTEDGYIVTNHHVIENATEVSVIFEDGKEYFATIIGEDRKSDLAVLKINETGLPHAQFGDSDELEVGERVVAIGNPMGIDLFGTTTQGIVSAMNRNITIDDRVMTLIQTDAAINEGNSGGALINQYGQVIGINSIKVASSSSGMFTEGLNFAIPSNIAVPVIDSLIRNGYVKDRPLIGISGSDVASNTAHLYDIPQGIWVERVTSGSGAEEAGILPGDIVTKINGKIVRNMAELNAEKDRYKAGDIVTLTIYRDGQSLEKKVRLMEDRPT